MELSLKDTKKEQDKFLGAIAQGDSLALVNQFASLLVERDKLYLVAKSLCSHLCNGDEKTAEALFIGLLNEVAQKGGVIDFVLELSRQEDK
jgi:hypothetical protein